MGKAHDILIDFDNAAWRCRGRDSVSGGFLDGSARWCAICGSCQCTE